MVDMLFLHVGPPQGDGILQAPLPPPPAITAPWHAQTLTLPCPALPCPALPCPALLPPRIHTAAQRRSYKTSGLHAHVHLSWPACTATVLTGALHSAHAT